MKNIEDYSPAEDVQTQLEDLLRSHYPEFYTTEKIEEVKEVGEKLSVAKIYISIKYSKNNFIVDALVTFSQSGKESIAIFEYRKKKPPNKLKFYWYCVKDWND
jgi:hypothetical protein